MSAADAGPIPLTERDLELMIVALESAAEACEPGATRSGRGRRKPSDPLAVEYLHARDSVEWLRRELEADR